LELAALPFSSISRDNLMDLAPSLLYDLCVWFLGKGRVYIYIYIWKIYGINSFVLSHIFLSFVFDFVHIFSKLSSSVEKKYGKNKDFSRPFDLVSLQVSINVLTKAVFFSVWIIVFSYVLVKLAICDPQTEYICINLQLILNLWSFTIILRFNIITVRRNINKNANLVSVKEKKGAIHPMTLPGVTVFGVLQWCLFQRMSLVFLNVSISHPSWYSVLSNYRCYRLKHTRICDTVWWRGPFRI